MKLMFATKIYRERTTLEGGERLSGDDAVGNRKREEYCKISGFVSGVVIVSMASVSMSIFNTITFESLDVGSPLLVFRYILRGYESSSYMKVIGSRSKVHRKFSITAM